MKLPKYIATTPPPRESGLARAQDVGALTRTGDIEVWRGVSQLGGAMKGVADLGFRAWQERHKIDTGIQHAKVTSVLNIAFTDAIGELDNMPVETEAQRTVLRTQYNKQLESLYNDTLRNLDNRDAADRFKKSWEQMKPAFDSGIFQTLTGNLDKQQKYDKMTEWQAVLSNAATDDLTTAKENIKEDVERHIPLFGAAWAKNYIGNLDRLTADAREDFYNDLIYNGASDLNILAEQIRQDDSVDKKQLLKNIDEERSRRETQSKLLQEQKDDEISEEFLGLLINKLEPTKPQLTFDAIETSDLSFDVKAEWFAKLRTFDNYSEGELKEAFTDKGEVLANIYDKIDNETLTDELDTMVGKGLSPVTAERIKKEIRAPYEKDSEQMFKRIFGWTPELGFRDNVSAFLYEKTLREWKAEVKKQDATGEDIIKLGREIARPYFVKRLQKVLKYQEKDIAEIVELALGEPEEVEKLEKEKTAPVLPKTVEKPELYEVGEIRTDEKGQSWEYIGNDKWRKK